VPNSKLLINPAFTWWTVGYLLSYEGAKKLVDQEPLQKFIPTDEYLPIMFDQHPEEKFKLHFGPRNLKAFAIEPVIIRPTHYTSQEGYISDTSVAPSVSDLTEDDLIKLTQHDHISKEEL
ncbi:hypothetical protein Anas_13873, partial [Armadillidium nasatum]